MTTVWLDQLAPDFVLPATDNKLIHLYEFKNQKNVVLYFYPKDSTPGCTLESQDFRDHLEAFTKLDTVIFGISRDTLKSHENFKIKQSLPFDLLSDINEDACLKYDVMRLKNMYGKQVRGIERSTFLIDKSSKVVNEWRKVSVNGHVAEVLAAVKALTEGTSA